jgi:hypothetical protein
LWFVILSERSESKDPYTPSNPSQFVILSGGGAAPPQSKDSYTRSNP